MKILRIDPFSGISGDMFVAAAAQLTQAQDEVLSLPDRLGLKGVKLEFIPLTRASIKCYGFKVREIKEGDQHSHHHHRSLSHILKMVESSQLDESVKKRAENIFYILAEAEAAVHGTTVEEVHFHEVGALDSIIDVTAAAFLIERLGCAKTYCSPVRIGSGFVITAHGRLPVPAPATSRLLLGMPVWTGDEEGEFTTPTGAAILRHLAPEFSLPVLSLKAESWGAGEREFSHPNALRLAVGELLKEEEEVMLIQANIDDLPPEFLGADLLDELLKAGALDAFITPTVMKKGRPGHKIEILAPADRTSLLADCLLEHTLTLGVRIIPIKRRTLFREVGKIETKFGEVKVKQATTPSGKIRIIPEYEDCRRLALELKIPVYLIYRAALGVSL